MRYDVRKNWIETLELMITKPIVIMPFIFIAFLEILALEFLFFSARAPLAYVANPIIRKFFGEAFIHYPGNLIILPQLFYYKQVGIYILLGVFLTAVSVNIFKNVRGGLPVTIKAMVRNALNNYASFLGYGVLMVALILLFKKIDIFILSKVIARLIRHLSYPMYNVLLTISLFLINLIIQALLITAIPIMVIKKKRLFKAIAESLVLGVRNFFTMSILIFLPFFVYLPMIFLKSFSAQLIEKTFPEISLYVTLAGIITLIFLDCFTILCVSQFLLDKEKAGKKAA